MRGKIDNGKTETQSLVGLLAIRVGLTEGLKDLRQEVRFYARPIIHYAQNRTSCFAREQTHATRGTNSTFSIPSTSVSYALFV